MSVVNPVCYTDITDSEVLENRPTTEELMRKIIQNINMLGKLAILAQVRAIALNQSGAPTPSTDIWQRCDGAEITNPDSPIASIEGFPRSTPNMRDRFVRGANGSTTIDNELGGASTYSTEHSHGGITATVIAPDAASGEEGTDHESLDTDPSRSGHWHAITPSTLAVNLNPLHQQVEFFLKIQ